MEGSAKRINIQDALSHCSKQARKVKNLVKRAKSFANQSESQAEKVDVLSGEAALSLYVGLEEALDADKDSQDESVTDIQLKLKKVLARTKRGVAQEMKVFAVTTSNSDIRVSFNSSTRKPDSSSLNFVKLDSTCWHGDFVVRIGSRTDNQGDIQAVTATSPIEPKLPILPAYSGCEYANSECTSDTDSEFFPDWSSTDSVASDRYQDKLHLGESSNQRFIWPDRIETFYGDEDVLRLSEDDFDDLFEDDNADLPCVAEFHPFLSSDKRKLSSQRPNEFNPIHPVIMPAAGKEKPGTSQQPDECSKKDDATSPGHDPMCPASDPTCIKPQAIRRVKSMILESDLNDSMAIGARMLVLQQKRNNDSTAMPTPSPLLSTEDVSSLKKSPSQLSARYTLKRSRSNISVNMTPLRRGDVPLLKPSDDGAIQEEDGEDTSLGGV